MHRLGIDQSARHKAIFGTALHGQSGNPIHSLKAAGSTAMRFVVLQQRLLRAQARLKGDIALGGRINRTLVNLGKATRRRLCQRGHSNTHNLAYRAHIVVGNPLPELL